MPRYFLGALAGGLGLLVLQHTGLVALRVVAEGFAFALCLGGRRLVAVPAVFAAVILPLAGHAAQVQPEPAGAVFTDALHVLSAAMWAGGILALAGLRPPGGWRSAEARLLLERFGRVAVMAFAITALTGVLRATEQLHGFGDLLTTTYGLVLDLKLVGVLAMLGVSALWRRGSRLAALDATFAGGVVLATAVLATLPPPA